MEVIKINNDTLDRFNNEDDVFKSISLYGSMETMKLSDWVKMTLELGHEAYGLVNGTKLIVVAALDEASDYRMSKWKEIRSLYAHPEYATVEFGSHLINSIVDRVDDRGYENTYVWVMEEDQDARDFFELQNIIPNGNRQQRIINGQSEELLRYVYVNL